MKRTRTPAIDIKTVNCRLTSFKKNEISAARMPIISIFGGENMKLWYYTSQKTVNNLKWAFLREFCNSLILINKVTLLCQKNILNYIKKCINVALFSLITK